MHRPQRTRSIFWTRSSPSVILLVRSAASVEAKAIFWLFLGFDGVAMYSLNRLMNPDSWQQALESNVDLASAVGVIRRIEQHFPGSQTLIVGGATRDLAMGMPPHDIDIATNVPVERLEGVFQTRDLGKSRDFGIVVICAGDGHTFEVAHFRRDGEYSDARRPDSVELIQDFRDDARRRDFTINAMGLTAAGEIIDHFGGQDDIRQRVIRTVGDPYARFHKDRLRVFRAARFAARLNFDIDPLTAQAMADFAGDLGSLPGERVREEFFKASVSGPSLARFVEILDHAGILRHVLPEVADLQEKPHDPRHHPEGDAWQHTLAALNAAPDAEPLAHIAVLFHDIGKAVTLKFDGDQPTYHGHEAAGEQLFTEIARRFCFSLEQSRALGLAIGSHMHGHRLNTMNKGRVLSLRQHPDWAIFRHTCYCDEAARGEPLFHREEFEARFAYADEALKTFGDKQAFEERMARLVNGRMIMAVLPHLDGREIGRIKDAVRAWIVGREFDVTEDEVQSQILAAHAEGANQPAHR